MDPKKLDFKSVSQFYPPSTSPAYQPYGDVTAPTPPQPIRPNVRAALDYLDGIFARGGQDAQDLWDILTAFRGPDNKDDEDPFGPPAKETVTVPIRRAALPKTSHVVNDLRSQGYVPNSLGVHQRASFGNPLRSHYPYQGARTEQTPHFASHGFRAAQALGLI